jgi:hypothetical protein
MSNCNAVENLQIGLCRFFADNCRFSVQTSGNNFWSWLAEGSVVSNSAITVYRDPATDTFSSFYPQANTTKGGFYLTMNDCQFVAGAGATAATKGYAINAASVYSGAQPFLLTLNRCSFDPLFDGCLNAFNNGNYVLKNCQLAGTGVTVYPVRVGSSGANYGTVVIDGCDFSRVTGTYNVFIEPSTTNWSLTWQGNHKYTDFKFFYTGSLANVSTKMVFAGIFTSASRPTAAGVLGLYVRLQAPAFGTTSGYICTTSNLTAATFSMTDQAGVAKNTTANRPTLSAADSGVRYLDTTLVAAGKPINWTGTQWVDSVGVVV